MIPTMILVGLVFGRWWRTALVLGAVAWPALLLHDGTITASQIPAAAAFGLANTGIGVALHQGALWLVRRAWSSIRRQAPTSAP